MRKKIIYMLFSYKYELLLVYLFNCYMRDRPYRIGHGERYS